MAQQHIGTDSRAAEGDLLELARGTASKRGKRDAIVGDELVHLAPLVTAVEAMHKLLDAVGVVNGLVLEGREAVVEHHVLYVQAVHLVAGTALIVLD